MFLLGVKKYTVACAGKIMNTNNLKCLEILRYIDLKYALCTPRKLFSFTHNTE